MLAFLGNLGPWEIAVILIVAVLIFGDRLPEAASKAYLQFRKLRQSVDDLRRDTGIDRELRNIERSVRDAAWEARSDFRSPAEPRAPRAEPSAPPPLELGPPSAPPPETSAAPARPPDESGPAR
jgi:Sec-independent protein translocase protein TatA